MTLVELLVAIGLTSILGLAVVSGSLFIQRFITFQLNDMALNEEMSLISQSLSDEIRLARRVSLYDDSLICHTELDEKRLITWHDHLYRRNGHRLSRTGFHVVSIDVVRIPSSSDSTEAADDQSGPTDATGMYRVGITLSDSRQKTDSIEICIRNEYEYQRFQYYP